MSGPLTDVTVDQQLQDIICLAGSGGTGGGGGGTVPEPASMVLASLGLSALAMTRRRKS
ncbi:PEP-CTERM sorting domain-containing protein [Zoogloea sp.]|uniref:PEP-CTERM sorting domain-containing protein n=1 Tax=Zoogloea sp. TaxID=49181 RepID=UPI0037D9E23C